MRNTIDYSKKHFNLLFQENSKPWMQNTDNERLWILKITFYYFLPKKLCGVTYVICRQQLDKLM